MTGASATTSTKPAPLEVRDVSKVYEMGSPLERALGRAKQRLIAVSGVTFSVAPGEALGIVGESGSGKSVTADMVVALQAPSGGSITYGGKNIHELSKQELLAYRRAVQIVFQNPHEALNPTRRIVQSVIEPLQIHGIGTPDERRARAVSVFREVGLAPPEDYLERYPHELSGGELQRVAIARALILDPQLIVADEPTSMLDVSVRAGVLNLLRKLRRDRGLSLVFISHDFSTIRYICDRTAVMHAGEIVEIGPTRDVIDRHYHPYTSALISAVPIPGGGLKRKRVLLSGVRYDPTSDLPGCRFASRCPLKQARCEAENPHLRAVAAGHEAACHLLESVEGDQATEGASSHSTKRPVTT